MITPVKRLGAVLVGQGVISPSQLAEALALQKTTGEFLGLLLVRMSWINEEQLLAALSEQFGISRIKWEGFQVDWSLAGQFPRALVAEHACFPVHMDTSVLTVAIANPLDAWAVSTLEEEAKARGRKLTLMLATGTEIAGAIRKHQLLTLQKIQKSFGGGHAKQAD
jgi:type IV pilus assembly protein PilB